MCPLRTVQSGEYTRPKSRILCEWIITMGILWSLIDLSIVRALVWNSIFEVYGFSVSIIFTFTWSENVRSTWLPHTSFFTQKHDWPWTIDRSKNEILFMIIHIAHDSVGTSYISVGTHSVNRTKPESKKNIHYKLFDLRCLDFENKIRV